MKKIKQIYIKFKKNGLKNSFARAALYIKSYGVKGAVRYVTNSKEGHLSGNARLQSDQWVKMQLNKGIILDQKINLPDYASQIAIHIHAFYYDIFREIIDAAKNVLQHNIHLRVTVVDTELLKKINACLQELNIHNFKVILVENCGRDIAPLFNASRDIFSDYAFVCHLHTKKSPHTNFGKYWRDYLVDSLVGDAEIVEKVIAKLSTADIGMLYPVNYSKLQRLTALDSNTDNIAKILSSINPNWKYKHQDYPAGSMCWIKTAAFKNILERFPENKDYGVESGKVDNTTAHAMERLLTLIPTYQGYKTLSYWKAELFRDIALSEFSANCNNRWARNTAATARNPSHATSKLNLSFNSESINIHWVIPDFVKGAGGHQTIFRMVRYIEKLGHRQTIWIQNGNQHVPNHSRLDDINKWYGTLENTEICHLPSDVEWISGDAVIATDCWSTYPVAAMKFFKQKFYFIQDWEPLFYPSGTHSRLIEETYKFGFYGICAGSWLLEKAQDAGMNASSFNLCTDKEIYSKKRTVNDGFQEIKIAFYSRYSTDRRCVELGLEAFQELWERGYQFKVFLFGQKENPAIKFSFLNENLGVISPTELSELYNKCDIGVVFSSTNYSLIPLEMMSCGLPVVELDVESIRHVFPDDVLSLAKPTPINVADKLAELIDDKTLRDSVANAGHQYANRYDWSDSALSILNGIKTGLTSASCASFARADIIETKSKDGSATIVIPTYNPGKDILNLIASVQSQHYKNNFEILIVDSESSDGSIDLVRATHPDIKIIEIQKSEFQHGRTRNFAISQSKSEFVVFLTQDAIPVDNSWLSSLLAGFDSDPEVLGVFGRHVARKEHGIFVQHDIDQHFNHQRSQPNIRSWRMDGAESPNTISGMMMRMFYSDNNSALRRCAAQHIQYPAVDWGEDQVWAWEVIKSGFKIAYADTAAVFHSHEHEKSFESAFKEEEMFYKYFGIRLYSNEDEVIQAIANCKNVYKDLAGIHHASNFELEASVNAASNGIKARAGRYYFR